MVATIILFCDSARGNYSFGVIFNTALNIGAYLISRVSGVEEGMSKKWACIW